MSKIYVIVLLLLVIPNVVTAEMNIVQNPINIVRENDGSWVCVDYAVNFSQMYPEWGVVTVSNNRYFLGVPHYVNYQIIDNDTIRIHDEYLGGEYNIHGWQDDGMFYHFWIDETKIIRNYKKGQLLDNRAVVIQATP